MHFSLVRAAFFVKHKELKKEFSEELMPVARHPHK